MKLFVVRTQFQFTDKRIKLLCIGALRLSTPCVTHPRTYFQEQLTESRPVRFIYRGSVLEDDQLSLEQMGIGDNGVLHVHIGRPRPQGANGGQAEEDVLDLSRLFVPLFGVLLGIVWVALLTYPYVFTFITKLMLFFLFLGYVFLAYVTTRSQ